MSAELIRLLLVEDNPADADLIEEHLKECSESSFEFTRARRLAEIPQQKADADVILLDLSLPDAQGIETLQRALNVARDTPIIVCTGVEDEQLGVDAIQAGAQDYIPKANLDARTLSRSIRYAIERKRAEKIIFRMAHYDSITDLPNRVLFMDRIERTLGQSRRHSTSFAVMYLDLDHFKDVNDTLGHAGGDELLAQTARCLTSSVRSIDTVARFGGDEFALLLPEIRNAEDAALVARKILAAMSEPVVISGKQHFATASIGISLYPTDGKDIQTLLKHADQAMYRAKQDGRATYRFFEALDQQQAGRKMAALSSLHQAIRQNEFCLFYQPRVEVLSGKITGMESLIRWRHPNGKLSLPATFIPLAERSGLISPMGEWVIREACHQWKEWSESGASPPPISVNVSAHQLSQVEFPDFVSRILTQEGFKPDQLEIELTETQLIPDDSRILETLLVLKSLGVTLSVDDFGTGYASFNYLTRFPLTYVKIDKSFVQYSPDDRRGLAVVKALLQLSKAVGMRSIAEGVETVEQMSFLTDLGCDEVQGFYVSRPLPPHRLRAFLKDWTPET